jgi:hypothetical protein
MEELKQTKLNIKKGINMLTKLTLYELDEVLNKGKKIKQLKMKK